MPNFKTQLRDAKKHQPEPGTIAELEKAQRVARCRVCIAMSAAFGNSVAQLMWKLLSRKDEIAVLQRRLAELDTYTVGTFGQQLGVYVTTSCVLIDSAWQRKKAQLAAAGPAPAAHRWMRLCHRCDVEQCVAADHLFWGTQQDNMRDMVLKQRGRRVKRSDVLSHLRAEWTFRIVEAERRMGEHRGRLCFEMNLESSL